MKNIWRYGLFVMGLVLLIWMSAPQDIPVSVPLPNRAEPLLFTINPPIIDTQVFGVAIKKDFRTKLGLDLQGGSHLVFRIDTSELSNEDIEQAIVSTRDIMERRVNMYGVAETVVQTVKQGNEHRITVDLPGVHDTQQAIDLVGKTAKLAFKEEEPPTAPEEATATPIILRLTRDTGLGGEHVQKAQVVSDQRTGDPQVALTFDDEGAKLFAEITERNVKKPLAITVDDTFVTYPPTVNEPITTGEAVISGDFTYEEANQLAIAINAGALPVSVSLVEQRSIGPSLGAEEIQKSLIAGIVGLVAVVLFMIGAYRKMGIVAFIVLSLYGMISLAIMRFVGIVFTLPGIAGFILSIGMAVDANILIFERIKEEQRKGKPFAVSMRSGFSKAIQAIKDANITTMLVSFILFNPLNWDFFPQFGLVRGFALTLGIGVAVSLFTGIVVTRRVMLAMYQAQLTKSGHRHHTHAKR